MSALHYQDGTLFFEGIDLQTIAKQFGTPCYVYSKRMIETRWQCFSNALKPLDHLICYAVKANSNLHLLQILTTLNSGFDIVSGGELHRVLTAGGKPQQIVFSGVGKTFAEMKEAISQSILCFNVESIQELERLADLATHVKTEISVTLRVNPNINPETHHHIATGLQQHKFGLSLAEIIPLAKKIQHLPMLKLIGLSCHLGSQITKIKPLADAADCLITLYEQLKKENIMLTHLDMGGGLGISNDQTDALAIEEYGAMLKEKFSSLPVKIIIEPGRAIIGPAGILLTKVEYVKSTQDKDFVILDAGMNDFMRPALYGASHDILPVQQRHGSLSTCDIVGPVCESTDKFAENRKINAQQNDLLAITCTGAYGFSMSSNYNSRCRPAEVLVDEQKMQLIRRRENFNDLLAAEMN